MDIGSTLRNAREAKSISLAEAATATRIREGFLEALENNEFHRLPGDLYLRGFLRNYATFLGLDAATLLAELGESSNVVRLPARSQRADGPVLISEPLTSNPIPFARILTTLLGLVIVGLVAFAIWGPGDALLDYLPGFADPTVTVPVTSELGLSPGDVTPTALLTEETSTPEEEASGASGDPTPVPTATFPPRTATPAPNPTNTPTPTATATTTPQADGTIVLQAQILDRTWTEVYLDGQDAVVYRVLEPGESYEWIAEEELYIRIGNAAGISLNLNGEELGVMGGPGGLVVRHWQRNPEGGTPVLIDSQGG